MDMTEEDQNEYELFVSKALRALHLQNCTLEKQMFALQARIHTLEEQIVWNTIYGGFELPPKETIVRSANGNLCVKTRRETEEAGLDETADL